MFRKCLIPLTGLLLALGANPSANAQDVQVSNLTFDVRAGRSVRLEWTRGNLDGVIVVIRLSSVGSVPPADGTDYTPNPEFGDTGSEIPPNNYVVYKGTGTSVLVTGLTMSTSHSVEAYEFSGDPASPTFLPGPDSATDATTNYAVHNYDYRVDCGKCHNHGSFFARGAELKAVCSTCHNPTGLASAKLEFGYEEVPTTTGHAEPTRNPDIDVVDCGMCHEVHNHTSVGTDTTLSTNSVTLAEQHNKSFLRANVDKHVSGATTPAYLHTDTPGGATPDRAVEGGTDAVDPPTATQARGYCQVCHTMTTKHRSSNTAGSDQCHDGNLNDSCSGTEVNCGDCHQHTGNFEGAGDCTTCHSSARGIRPEIVSQFDRASSHVTPSVGGVTEEDCLVCHDQATHRDGQTVRINDPDDINASFSQPTAAAPTLQAGQGSAYEPACLNCHDTDGATRLTGNTGDQTPMSPFTDAPLPLEFDAATWAQSSHGASSIVTCLGDGTGGGCHGSGHGSVNNALLAPAATDEGADYITNLCAGCHDNDGPSTLNVAVPDSDLYDAGEFDWNTTRQAVANTGALVNQRHDVIEADQQYSTGDPQGSLAFDCGDCHRPHEDASQSIVGSVVQSNPVAHPDTGAALPVYSMENHYVGDATTIAVSNVTKGSSTTITTSAPHGWISGDTVCVSDIVDNGPNGDLEAALNGNDAFTITFDSASTFTIPVDTTGLTNVYASGGGATRSDTCFTYYDGTDAYPDLDPTNPLGGATYPTPVPEPDYIEFCLVCHDGTTPPGVTMSPNMLNMAVSYSTNDQHGRKEGRNSPSRGYLKQPWANQADYDAGSQPGGGSGTYAALNCTLCHGPHGSGNIFNLRTSITVNGTQMTVGGKDAFKDPNLCERRCGGTDIDEEFPDFGQPTYFLPVNAQGDQEELGWGAWCTFCHEPSHGTSDGLACQASHLHGGTNF